MSVIRVEKTTNYTVMSNYHFKEKEMSLKAKGLLSLMLSLPEKWDYSIAGLVAICKENETSIKSALDELKEFGYLEVIKRMPNETKTGRIEYEYIVYEQKQEGKKQDIENLGVEIQGVEKLIQLNTNNKELNNKVNNNKELLLDGFNLSEKVKAMVYVWLGYKKEKGQTYKPVGLNTLLKKIEKWQNEFGEDYVINAIDSSITNNYAGLFPAKQQYKSETTFSQRTYTKEQMNELFDDIDKIEI